MGVVRGRCGGVAIALSKEVQEVVRVQEEMADPPEDPAGRESHRQLLVWLLELPHGVVYAGSVRLGTWVLTVQGEKDLGRV